MEGKWAAPMPTFLFIMIKEELKKKIKEVIESKGFELFSIEWKGSEGKGVLCIKIDSPAGITIKDCEDISKTLSTFLDIENPFLHPYRLEVSSPGIERPLRSLDDFIRFKGKPVIIYSENKNFRGIIMDVVENSIYLKMKNQIKQFIFDKIEKSNLLGPWEDV